MFSRKEFELPFTHDPSKGCDKTSDNVKDASTDVYTPNRALEFHEKFFVFGILVLNCLEC